MLYLGVIGYPIKHSVSPAMHNAALLHEGIEGIYLAFEVKPDRLRDAVFGAKALGFRGLNVTIPFKESVVEFVELEGEAAKIKTVNTIDLVEMVGYNTDVYGVKAALSGTELGGKTALVVGAGGAGKAAALALLDMGSTVIVANRTEEKGREAAEMLRRYGGGIFWPVSRVEELKGKVDVVVNATPLGMRGFKAEIPVPPSMLDGVELVFDTVYNPMETPLIREAKRRGCKVVYGIEMLVHQGAKAFEIWTGIEPDVEVMKEAALRALRF